MICEKNEYTVDVIGQSADRLLSSSHAQKGSVLLASRKGWYLLWEEEILLICDSRFGIVPAGMGISDFREKFPFGGIWENVSAEYSGGRLFLPFCTLDISGARHAPQQRSSYSGGPLSALESQAEALLFSAGKGYLYTLLQDAEDIIAGSERRRGETVCSGQAFEEQSRIRLRKLFSALNECDPGRISECTEGLLGLGNGLTPSADDWLLAFLYTLDRISEKPETEHLRQALKRFAQSRTHPISASYLMSAVRREYFELLENVLRFSDRPHMEALLEAGSSSGADMLTGVCFAVKYAEEKERNW